MKFLTKLRKKWILTIITFTLVTFFNWTEIPIQDNYVTIVIWLFGFIFGGHIYKKYLESKS